MGVLIERLSHHEGLTIVIRVVSFTYIDAISSEAIQALLVYLGHKFPKVRCPAASEHLALTTPLVDPSRYSRGDLPFFTVGSFGRF